MVDTDGTIKEFLVGEGRRGHRGSGNRDPGRVTPRNRTRRRSSSSRAARAHGAVPSMDRTPTDAPRKHESGEDRTLTRNPDRVLALLGVLQPAHRGHRRGFPRRRGAGAGAPRVAAGQVGHRFLLDGASDIAQSAPAQGFLVLERGERPAFAHFAQINEMDGFFIAAREPDPDFSWSKLCGTESPRRPLRDSRSPCSSTPAANRASTTPRSTRWMPATSTRWTAPSAPARETTSTSRGPRPSNWSTTAPGHVGRVGRRRHRPLRLLEPRRHAGLAGHRRGGRVHARLPEVARLGQRYAGGGDRRRREGVSFPASTPRC